MKAVESCKIVNISLNDSVPFEDILSIKGLSAPPETQALLSNFHTISLTLPLSKTSFVFSNGPLVVLSGGTDPDG